MPVPISTAHDYFLSLQASIVSALEEADGSRFKTDNWKRPEGGGGVSRYLENGPLIERGAVVQPRARQNLASVGQRPSARAGRPPMGKEGCRWCYTS